ncbi:Protein of unknown function [Rhizobiales bacterium GAS188]|nr:Protein of unknown function [Rhizobiales bacterium GAS188]
MSRADPQARSLTPSQQAALRHVRAQAILDGPNALAALRERVGKTGAGQAALDEALLSLRDHARVVVQFHPDRLTRAGESVADNLLRDGRYRNQFETGISNGGLSAFEGGERDLWEAGLFGGAYQARRVTAAERPKYGALDFLRYGDGPAPRFGSCYLILRPAIADRCSLTVGDSHRPIAHVGVRDAMEGILLGLVDAVGSGEWDLGRQDLAMPGLAVPSLLDRLSRTLGPILPDPARRPPGRLLDHYIEAQIHGPIDLRTDVDLLVADPCFQGTPTGERLRAACSSYGVAVSGHCGFVLAADSVDGEFRGPAMPALARRIAKDGFIDAAVIGAAAASLNRHPELWRDRGTYEETLQHLKQLWHVLVHKGHPAMAAET